MIQNLRVDTIYYLTNSDFEMEFNLCGCCKKFVLGREKGFSVFTEKT